MRLRQIALAARDLDVVTHGLTAVFGLKVAYNDGGVLIGGVRFEVVG